MERLAVPHGDRQGMPERPQILRTDPTAVFERPQIQTEDAVMIDAVEEDGDLQKAIQASLQDRMPSDDKTVNDTVPPPVTTPQPQPLGRPGIEDYIQDIALRKAMEFPMINDANADTWIFIDAPPQQPEQDDLDYSQYKQRCCYPHAMQKAALQRLSSPVINRMLEPTMQHRTLRRRNLVNRLPPTIKYVLDLTPPAEGEDAVWCTASLCCPEGIRLWRLAAAIWKISPSMVGGEEDFTSLTSRMASKNVRFLGTGPCTEPADRMLKHTPRQSHLPMITDVAHQLSLVPEYTLLRHHTAIERLLAVAQGEDPMLDSAPKVWTLFAVARYFEIVHSPLTDYVVRWLRAAPNSVILEVLPEVCLIIADQFQIHDLARDAFAILVGETALDKLAQPHNPTGDHPSSIFERKKQELPEALKTRVDYAAEKFTDRCIRESAMLLGRRMQWIEDLPEFKKLRAWKQPELQAELSKLEAMLKEYVLGTLHETLRANYFHIVRAVNPSNKGAELFPNPERAPIWNRLGLSARLFTRTFWTLLLKSDLFRGQSNDSLPGLWYTRTNEGHQEPESPPAGFDWPSYQSIGKAKLHGSIKHCRELAYDFLHSEPLRTDEVPIATAATSQSPQNISYQSTVPGLVSNLPIRSKPVISDNWDDPAHDEPSPNSQINWSNEEVLPLLEGESHTSSLLQTSFSDDVSVVSEPHSPETSYHKTALMSELTTAQQAIANKGKAGAPGQANAAASSSGAKPTESPLRDFRNYSFFRLSEFFEDVENHIQNVAIQMLAPTDKQERHEHHEPTNVLNTLVTLKDGEFKYLPLWAGGDDDGSGGVFNDDVPISESGFATAGPGIHTGSSRGSTSSEFDMLSNGSETDFNTSTATMAGFSNDLRPAHVYAASSIEGSSVGDDFVTVSGTDLFSEAERQRAEFEDTSNMLKNWPTQPAEDEEIVQETEDYSDLFQRDSDDDDEEQEEIDEDSDDALTVVGPDDFDEA